MRNNHELPASPSSPADALPDSLIDHPSLRLQWAQLGGGQLSDYQQTVLRDRYEGSGVDSEKLIEAVGLACIRSDAMRQLHQAETTGVLERAGVINWYDYVTTVGEPERLIDHLTWFDESVDGYIEKLEIVASSDDPNRSNRNKEDSKPFLIPGEKPPHKLGIEVGGNKQRGSWESARELDEVVRAIPGLGLEDPKTCELSIRQQIDERLTSFRYEPINDAEQFGLFRRRRQVGDYKAGANLLMVYKETMAVVVLSQISQESRKVVAEDVKNNPGINSFAVGGKNDTAAAVAISKYSSLAGKEAESLINDGITDINSLAEESKALIRPIAPVSAHYVVVRLVPSMLELANNRQ